MPSAGCCSLPVALYVFIFDEQCHPLTVHQAFAIGLRGITCDPGNGEEIERLYENDIINRGKTKAASGDGSASTGTPDQVVGNCKKAFADQAMQFVTCGFALATIALVFLVWKKNRSGGGRAYV